MQQSISKILYLIYTIYRNVDVCIIYGKLLEIHLLAWLFSNPCGKVLIIVGISYSLDLRVQPKCLQLKRLREVCVC